MNFNRRISGAIAALFVMAASSPALADEVLGLRIADLVGDGYSIEGTALAIHTLERQSKLYYRTSTMLVRGEDVVQCFQSYDEFYQLEFHRCIHLSERADKQ